MRVFSAVKVTPSVTLDRGPRTDGQNRDILRFAARGGDFVYLVRVVYLVCLVGRARSTRQTYAPDRLLSVFRGRLQVKRLGCGWGLLLPA